MKGSTRKYVDRKCLLCSTKFVLMKKCCQNIHIQAYKYVHLYIYRKREWEREREREEK